MKQQLAPCLMIQGTASSVGKSLLALGLCRYFRRNGVRVAPFKSQNMALNSAVTPDGLEIGRAQALQAEAAGVVPRAVMNPILLKPEGDRRSQVVVLGRSIGSQDARTYHDHKPQLRQVVADSLAQLRAEYELVVIEGAGSPAEVNLKAHELVNMFVATLADAKVLLVGDIDRGGVFAALVGTLALLEPDERERIGGFLINKFRGDKDLLEPGLDFLVRYTGKPVLGVLPYLPRLRLADEDSLSLSERLDSPGAAANSRTSSPDRVSIAVVRLPRLSNHDDFLPLEHEPSVRLSFEDRPDVLLTADLVILPGSKSTASDLAWLHQMGLAQALAERARLGGKILGICGGCQMLGQAIQDPEGLESTQASVPGLGLLPFCTVFVAPKTTAQVVARAVTPSFLAALGSEVRGYEIHLGRLLPMENPRMVRQPAFQLTTRHGKSCAEGALEHLDGAVSGDGTVVGTLLHGIFENRDLLQHFVTELRRGRGAGRAVLAPERSAIAEFDRVADAIAANVDEAALWRLARLPQPTLRDRQP